jgi:hypothetical protein
MLMWFVNIDHWTIKLAYLVLQKLSEDLTDQNHQVDIYGYKGARCSICRVIHCAVDWIHAI